MRRVGVKYEAETAPRTGAGRACCICGAGQGSEAVEGFAPWTVRRCRGCGLVYLDGQADQAGFVGAAEEQLHGERTEKTVEYWSFPEMYARYRGVFDGYFAGRLRRLRQYRPGLKKVLDIGCGFGFFLRYLQDKGLEVAGLDLEERSVRYAREQLELEVAQCAFEEYEAQGRFDAIAACDVLEHVERPGAFLAKCRELLEPGGVIYVQVPNVLGEVLPPGGSFNWPYHLWQFGPETLAALLRGAGFSVCQWWTGVMGVIGVYEAGGPDAATRAMWRRARRQKRGNRLQMLARPV